MTEQELAEARAAGQRADAAIDRAALAIVAGWRVIERRRLRLELLACGGWSLTRIERRLVALEQVGAIIVDGPRVCRAPDDRAA